jgi:hypothetical protein
MRIIDRARSKFIAARVRSPEDALHEAAYQAVKGSVNAEFKPDPIFTAEFSRLLSTANSVVKKHGPMIEDAIAAELERAKLTVKRNTPIPISGAALAMVNSRDYPELSRQQFAFDEKDIADTVDVDILAIDEFNGWACAVSVKRGNGFTEPKKRKANERELRALELTLASRLRQQGYPTVETAAVGVIDYFGQSGFSTDLAINGVSIDEFFDLPIVAAIDRMTASLKAAFDLELVRLLEPMLQALKPEASAAPVPTAVDDLRPRGRRSRLRPAPAGATSNFRPFSNFAAGHSN